MHELLAGGAGPGLPSQVALAPAHSPTLSALGTRVEGVNEDGSEVYPLEGSWANRQADADRPRLPRMKLLPPAPDSLGYVEEKLTSIAAQTKLPAPW